MGFDAIFKRYFAGVVCLLIGVAAYFQATGMGQLVASSVALDPSSVPAAAPLPVRAAAAPASTDHTTSATAILGRNPFDSVTGPLDGRKIELPDPTPAQEEVNRDPYDDPDCDAAKTLLIVASDDPQWSFAALVGPDGKSQLRRVGDEINGHTVQYIGDMRTEEQKRDGKREIYDRVWLQAANGGRCQIRIGGKAPLKAAAAAPAPSDAPHPPKGKKSKVPAEIAEKIHKISETEFNVERGAIDAILENQGELMKSARIVPEKEGDKVVGIRLFGIRPDSLLGTLGLENGDRLSSINGFEMSDPQKALEAYSKLKTAENITVAVNRHGKPVNIDFHIK